MCTTARHACKITMPECTVLTIGPQQRACAYTLAKGAYVNSEQIAKGSHFGRIYKVCPQVPDVKHHIEARLI